MYPEDKKAKEISYSSALSKMQFICSRQEKCCSDIRKKLDNWNLSYDDKDKIIQSLIDDKFLDERRYTGFYVRDKYKFNKWGRIKISHHLKQKQIPEHIIMEALDSISEDNYEENLEDILTSKMRSTREEDLYKLKAKLYRFAQSRGFESNLILRYIEKLVHKD
ncbi:RecX family transcriptional regulator [Ancylomarina euxinus]|uniref:Regulatory protein RecX n=1 Tax=Ancylomarina euxinus TaxID=2283627 RepID=A0A425Y8F7_9BACT|nr:regulatory protein RecX [Ancylomarina euxinus]MCZ4693434.1 regulatory protein RecX [Ancylomarina euxinus]MUP13661.1 RecX family transcriptional regulator [Ancylomarina euxinus]RRG24697.1 RecX family transcriptional regulator [Ancylomarina euxinus]